MKKKTLYLANVNHLFCIYMDQFSVIPISRVPGQPRVLPEILGPGISCEDLQNKQSFNATSACHLFHLKQWDCQPFKCLVNNAQLMLLRSLPRQVLFTTYFHLSHWPTSTIINLPLFIYTYHNMWRDSTDGRVVDSGIGGPKFKSSRYQIFCAMLQRVVSNQVYKITTKRIHYWLSVYTAW